MKAPDPIAVTDQVRDRVTAMVERLGRVHVEADTGWAEFAAACGLIASTERGPTSGDSVGVKVGAPASVLRYAAGATQDFGFVVPVAQIARPWQRQVSWRDDTTLGLWRLGWTPIAIDRIVVVDRDVRIELVIGNARRTPGDADSALDNSD